MRFTLMVFLTVIFISCATIVNKKYTAVNLYTKQDSIKVFVSDSLNYTYTPARLIVERSNKPLVVTMEKNGLEKKTVLPSKVDPLFWIGNILNGTIYFGYAVDLSNNKRFYYPKSVYMDFDHPQNIDFKYKTSLVPTNSISQEFQTKKKGFTGEKGMLNIKLSIPEGNSFIINKATHIGSSSGFLGITTGIDYYYKDKKYVGLGVGALTDFFIPFPAPLDVKGEYERSFGTYADLLMGIDIHRFSFNYGLSFSSYSYYKNKTIELFPEYINLLLYSKHEDRLGFSFSTKFKVTNYFNVGVKYLPSFYTLGSDEFRYGHMLFLDLALNYRIRTKRAK